MATYFDNFSQSKRRRNLDNINENNEEKLIQNTDPNEGLFVRRKRPNLPPNHVLLYTILNPCYPITTDVINSISSRIGKVNRIVIFRKRAVQAMVEFADVDTARKAMESLNGSNIYSGCCKLKIEFAKPTKLNVFKNDTDTWDFTLTNSNFDGKSALLPEPVSKELLQSPLLSDQLEINKRRSSFLEVKNCKVKNSSSLTEMKSLNTLPSIQACNNSDLLQNLNLTNVENSSLITTSTAVATSPVLMAYDLDIERTNCDKLFNLFCLYGNVARIKFLKTKEGCAMIQMSDEYAVDRCMINLNPTNLLNGHELSLGYSKQLFLSETRNSFKLPDGTEGFKDYCNNKHNRFSNRTASMKNRIHPPSRILHFYNTPTNISEQELKNIFENSLENMKVVQLKLFPKKGGADGIVRNSTGLVEFETIPEAVEALMTCNHLPIKSEGNKYPYIMKLCFSTAKSINYSPKEKEMMSSSVCDKRK